MCAFAFLVQGSLLPGYASFFMCCALSLTSDRFNAIEVYTKIIIL